MIDHFNTQFPKNAKAGRIMAAVRDMLARKGAAAPQAEGAGPAWLKFVPPDIRGLVASKLPAGLEGFLDGHMEPAPAPVPVPDGAQFLSRSFTNAAGSRPYKLFVPSGYHGQAVPLVVMLHGCTQSPDDFAAGTGMNQAAEAETFLVAYPGQTQAAHAQKCWKWFSAADQQRGQGEPSLIAGITRQVMADYAVDPRRVYAAGLSAGGAAAAVMGQAYPELYAAIGVHSGLACGVATDLPSALAAMKRGGSGVPGANRGRTVPTIVFHGDRDATVSPRNGDAVVAQALAGARPATQTLQGQAPGGHTYSRTDHGAGAPSVEQWVVHGAGHAWSGGSPAGTYTDPRGPDATREMLRFFWQHPHPSPLPG